MAVSNAPHYSRSVSHLFRTVKPRATDYYYSSPVILKNLGWSTSLFWTPFIFRAIPRIMALILSRLFFREEIPEGSCTWCANFKDYPPINYFAYSSNLVIRSVNQYLQGQEIHREVGHLIKHFHVKYGKCRY